MTSGSHLSAPRSPHHSPHHTTLSAAAGAAASATHAGRLLKGAEGLIAQLPLPWRPWWSRRAGHAQPESNPPSIGVLICSPSKVRSAAPGPSPGDGGPGVTGDPHHSLSPGPHCSVVPTLPYPGFMKDLGSFIFPPAVIQRVLTTRLLLGTGLSKYPRLS